MTILGDINYKEYQLAQHEENWAKAERYAYCDEFYDLVKTEKNGILHHIAAVLSK